MTTIQTSISIIVQYFALTRAKPKHFYVEVQHSLLIFGRICVDILLCVCGQLLVEIPVILKDDIRWHLHLHHLRGLHRTPLGYFQVCLSDLKGIQLAVHNLRHTFLGYPHIFWVTRVAMGDAVTAMSHQVI